jgi:hypothetical protein
VQVRAEALASEGVQQSEAGKLGQGLSTLGQGQGQAEGQRHRHCRHRRCRCC